MTNFLLAFAGVRQHALDAAWTALGHARPLPADFEHKAIFEKLAADFMAERTTMHPPYASQILAALVPEEKDTPLLIDLLDHEEGWVRIDACRALIFLRARQAAPRLRKLLKATPDDASHGVSMDLERFQLEAHTAKGFDEFNDPSPRFKYAWIVALGELGDDRDIPLLTHLVDNPGNVLEVQTAAARALAAKSNEPVLAQMQLWATQHTNHAVRMVARDMLRRESLPYHLPTACGSWEKPQPLPPLEEEALVFIKGPHDTGHHFEISKDQTAYSTTDSGPTYRFGHNLYLLHLAQNGTPRVEQLTRFQDAFVADLEVDYDGEWIVFCKRNREGPDPWWHLFEIRRDGTGLRQITRGPYHDVHPVSLPDGSIAFSSTRLGYRDEYHGYPATGLTTVRRDGSDIRVIGSNFGRDAEPAVDRNGRILFTRLELFYSRVKTEWTLMSAFPDGTRTETLYGPERRELFAGIGGASALSPARHRLLRITQPQPFGNNQYIINSFRGPMLVGPGRMKERFLRPDNSWAVTCPYPLDEHTLLVAAGKRTSGDLMAAVNHGLHRMDVATGELTLIYDDPDTADFEARPLRPRPREPILASPAADRASSSPTGVMMCNSVFESRQPHIARRARYIRVNEGIPVVERHNTHTNGGSAWRNHGGPIARVLGTLPLADDGSFSIELPADRLVHFQALDSDRQVIGNEINWQYARPGERVSCIGCHERPDTAPVSPSYPEAFTTEPLPLMPTDDDILYRAKMWTKGWADDEREARMRSVNSINTYGRE